MPDPATVPQVIDVGDGFVLTRARPGDELWITTAVEQSLEHLRPWMAWATPEQTSVDAQAARLARAADDAAGVEQLDYLVRHGRDPRVLGAASLVRRGEDVVGTPAWEIGYWIHVDWCRRGLATRSARALTDLAFRFAASDMVVIRCDAANDASAAVARALGFTLHATVDAPKVAPADTGRDMVWVRRLDV
jgi:RimJ/RimL family protein N-acetyltransferase